MGRAAIVETSAPAQGPPRDRRAECEAPESDRAGFQRPDRRGQETPGEEEPLSLAAVRNLREEHARIIEPAQAGRLERPVSDLVNEAYGLTPDEVRLIWETAPPRMPIGPPDLGPGSVESRRHSVFKVGAGTRSYLGRAVGSA